MAARAARASEVVHLHKGAVGPAVSGTVVVDQRLSFFGLGPKTVLALPGCGDTNQDDTRVRRPSSPERGCRKTLAPTFADEELGHVEAGPDGRRRVRDVSLRELEGVFLRVPLRPVNGVIVRCRELKDRSRLRNVGAPLGRRRGRFTFDC